MGIKHKILYGIAGISAIGAIICGIGLYKVTTEAKVDEDFDNSLVEQYTKSAPESVNLPSDGVLTEEKEIYAPLLEIDFNALQELNSDTVGWIHQEGTKINYPILQTGDNSTYLNKRFDGTSTERGCIFADYRVNLTESNNIILFGHNASQRTLTQFSSLHGYLNDVNYINENPSFELYDAATGECKVFDVFSVFKVDVSTQEKADWFYREIPNSDYAEYLRFLSSNSIYSSSIEPTIAQQTLVLSTCVTGHYNVRLVVCCAERLSD